jgi:hypothetical protein
VERANIGASLRATPGDAAAADDAVTGALEDALAGVGGVIVRSARSDTFDLPLAAPGAVPDLVQLGWMEGLADRATLVDGAWPEAVSATAADPVPVAVADVAAIPLGLSVGQELALTSRLADHLAGAHRGRLPHRRPVGPAWWTNDRSSTAS